MPKRGTNIYKRKDGRWEGRVLKKTAGNGKRSYISVYGKTYHEAKEKMDNLKHSMKKGEVPTGSTICMQEVIELWLKDKEACWKTSTYASYQNIAMKYIIPKLGQNKIARIDNLTLEEFATEIRHLPDGECLSNSYLHSICSIVIMALSHVKKKYNYDIILPENPVTQTKQGTMILPSEHDMGVLEQHLIKNADDDTCLGILIAFHTGIRIGELCALKWENIDLTEGTIFIKENLQRITNRRDRECGTELLFQTPKTITSLRVIPISPVLLDTLKKQYPGKSGYVVKGKKKPWAEPRTMQYRFSKILRDCSLSEFHFHMLRHAFATRCIDKGFDMKSLSEILGHSSIQITLNLYVHSTIQRKKQLMNLFAFPLQEEKSKLSS